MLNNVDLQKTAIVGKKLPWSWRDPMVREGRFFKNSPFLPRKWRCLNSFVGDKRVIYLICDLPSNVQCKSNGKMDSSCTLLIHCTSNPYLFKTTLLKLPKSVFWFSAWLTIESIVSSLVFPFCPAETWRDLTKSFNSGAAIRFSVSRRFVSWCSSSKKPDQKNWNTLCIN